MRRRYTVGLLVLCCMMVLAGCSKDNKEENLSSVNSTKEEVKKVDGLLKAEELPEPFAEYETFIQDGVLDVDLSGENYDIVVVDGISNSINYITNCAKYIPKDKKYQFNGFYYKETREDIIKGRKLAVFYEGNSNEEEGFELLVDNTDVKMDFESKPIISIVTDYSKIGVVKYGSDNNEKSDPGIRLVVSGNIAQFTNNDEYVASFNED